jgi:hypothetical protein
LDVCHRVPFVGSGRMLSGSQRGRPPPTLNLRLWWNWLLAHARSCAEAAGHNCRARSLVGLSRQSGFKAIITEPGLADEKPRPIVVAWNLAGGAPEGPIAMACRERARCTTSLSQAAVGTALANPYQRVNNRPELRAGRLVRVRGRCTPSRDERATAGFAATMRP